MVLIAHGDVDNDQDMDVAGTQTEVGAYSSCPGDTTEVAEDKTTSPTSMSKRRSLDIGLGDFNKKQNNGDAKKQHLSGNEIGQGGLAETSDHTAADGKQDESAQMFPNEDIEAFPKPISDSDIGIPISRISGEWARLHPTLPSIQSHIKRFTLGHLSFLLVQTPNLVLVGAGQHMRVSTVFHAKKYCRRFPPMGVKGDGTTPVLSIVTVGSALPAFNP